MSAFCSDDNYRVQSHDLWKANGRGVCLVTKITATIILPDGRFVDADPYTSSGTSYSNFGILELREGVFSVNRYVSNSINDEIPEDYIEPIEEQK